MISSSNILDGLSWWQSWLCVWIGYSIAAGFVCLTGRIGAKYHISFPVVCRSSFGIWGSLWPVLNRAGMAAVWYGVQGWIGGTCVYLMIRAIWPSWDSYGSNGNNNSMPTSSGTNTRDFVSFFLFWAGSLPFLWFPVHQIRHLFTVKAYFVPTAGIAFFIWAIVRADGLGPIVKQGSTLTGSKLGWAIVKGIMSAIANFATLIVNDPDFARFARKPRDALWAQLLTIPVGFAITSFIGIIVASSSNVIFGEPVWSPLTLLQKIPGRARCYWRNTLRGFRDRGGFHTGSVRDQHCSELNQLWYRYDSFAAPMDQHSKRIVYLRHRRPSDVSVESFGG